MGATLGHAVLSPTLAPVTLARVTDSTPRRLVVMRHARAEHSGPSDHERRLTDGGADDARAAGAWLAGLGLDPDHVLVSAALRTRETWEAVAEGAGWDDDATHDEGLYAAGPETALDLVRQSPADALTVVVVGHNPTMATLAQLLDDGEGDEEASNDLAGGFPTCAAAVLEVDDDWADLEEQSARLLAFHVSRS